MVRKLVDSNQHPRLGFMLACFPHVIARSVRCALPGTASRVVQGSNLRLSDLESERTTVVLTPHCRAPPHGVLPAVRRYRRSITPAVTLPARSSDHASWPGRHRSSRKHCVIISFTRSLREDKGRTVAVTIRPANAPSPEGQELVRFA